MSLFVVRPSRGTWAFFGLVVLGVLGTRAMRKHEARVIRQDRPASERAHDLAACLIGPHVAWVLRDPDGPDAQLRWTHDSSRVLRALVSSPQPEGWPRVCADIARDLSATLLRASTASSSARSLAFELRGLLDRASASPDERLALADNDQLASRLAALMMQVRALSTGSRATWDRGLLRAPPPIAITAGSLPALRGLPGAVDHPVLVDARTVLARGTWNGYAQALRVDGGAPRRTLLAPATALPEPARAGLVRAWRDDGPWMVSLSPRPTLLALPEGFATRDPASFRWDAARREDGLALLTLDGGTATLHARRDGAWTPAAAVGPGESVLAATLTEAWQVLTLRPGLSDVTLEQYDVRSEGGRLTVGPAEVVPLPAPLPGALTVAESCQSGGVAYFVVAERNVTLAVRVQHGVARVASARMSLPRGARLRVRCDDAQVIATPTPTSATMAAALFRFTGFAGGEGMVIDHPPGGVNEVHAMVLVRDGVLALASSPGALRAWRYRPQAGVFGRNLSRWEPGALLMDLVPGPRARRRVLSMQAESEGDAVTVLMELAQGPREFRPLPATQPLGPVEEAPTPRWFPGGRAVMVSRDGGRTFAAPY